jgi:hypothetical protein
MQDDDPESVKKVRRAISHSRLRDPLRGAPFQVRQIVGGFTTVTIMMVFVYLGNLILGEAGAALGFVVGLFLGLWLPPHLHEGDDKNERQKPQLPDDRK